MSQALGPSRAGPEPNLSFNDNPQKKERTMVEDVEKENINWIILLHKLEYFA